MNVFVLFVLLCWTKLGESIDPMVTHEIDSGPCNMPVEYEPISEGEFLEKYAYKFPVVFRHSQADKNRNKLFQQKCQIDSLDKDYGDKMVTIGTANTYSYQRSKIQLSEYLNKYVLGLEKESKENKIKYGNETWYFFGENNYTEWKGLFDLYERPKYSLPGHEHAYSFGVASLYTGVPFHFHGPGFAETLVGRKRWFLYHPEDRPQFDPDKSTLHWFLEEYPKLKAEQKPFECILEPLDVIYFPDRWWHATLNVDTAVFISTFLSPI